jgi:hypothetical protein
MVRRNHRYITLEFSFYLKKDYIKKLLLITVPYSRGDLRVVSLNTILDNEFRLIFIRFITCYVKSRIRRFTKPLIASNQSLNFCLLNLPLFLGLLPKFFTFEV